MNRRQFLQSGAILGGTFSLSPFQALSGRLGAGATLASPGYGPLVNKGDLWLPVEFHYQVLSVQGKLMSDGRPTPGIFDGMGAYPGPGKSTVLIRNHENRERAGEIKLLTGSPLEYDETTFGGNTKLEVVRHKAGRDPTTGQWLYEFEVVQDFAILGGTSTNCAGGYRHPHQWITCEEVVKRHPNGKKHGYIFEIDARATGPVPALPVVQAGRFAHEAALERSGIIYQTEDRDIRPDPVVGLIGSCFYRYVPFPRGGGVPLVQTSGPLQALAIEGEPRANMDFREVGVPYPVIWVDVPEPDHDDDSDDRRDRARGFTPTRIQAIDRGAAYFNRLEGIWAGPGNARVYFVTTAGGPANLGQVWEYEPGREMVTLIYESTDRARLENPDNVTIVPGTQDIFLCEDGPAEQFIRGVTQQGQIYDFARTSTNETEFCGACFDPDGQTLYVNQQGERGSIPDGPPEARAVTYAIYGPFENRKGNKGNHFR